MQSDARRTVDHQGESSPVELVVGYDSLRLGLPSAYVACVNISERDKASPDDATYP